MIISRILADFLLTEHLLSLVYSWNQGGQGRMHALAVTVGEAMFRGDDVGFVYCPVLMNDWSRAVAFVSRVGGTGRRCSPISYEAVINER